ncbi:hypothetical protein KNE206_18640 [Kitasatospora sp. NE20-6]|uniref:transglycosylase SLT domain-containing protein n=1 Tax=Kitasatospora sp. NE20-6 TaxID=2859066 RepID=UPI0034DCA6FF
MPGTDIVGTVGVDVVPIGQGFNEKMAAIAKPAGDAAGRVAGQAFVDKFGDVIGQRLTITLPASVTRAGQAAGRAAGRAGDDTAGAFARSVKSRLEVAFRSMPRLDIQVGQTGVDVELARLRTKLQQLSGKRIGIDISAADAAAKVAELDEKLARLGARHPNPVVRVDIGTARAALAEVRAEIAAIDGKTAHTRVDVDTSGAASAVLALAIQIGALAAIPAVPVLAVGVGGIASAFVAAGVGAGAFALAAAPALKSVTAALHAQSAAQQQATNGNITAQQHALSLAGAQQSLASAQRSAAQQVASANRQVESASRSLVDAQKAERAAQDDLTAARRTAEQQLQAYEDRLRDGALSEREAALRVAEAQENLQAVQAKGAAATGLERERAQLDYDRAVQAAKEAATAQRDLSAEAKAARDAGVDGSAVVQQAQDKLTQAQRRAVDASRAVADAQKAAASAQAAAAESVASAQRGLQQAMLSTEKSAGSADDALSKLSPSARALFDAIAGPNGLKTAFSSWSASMSPAVLPLFVRGVDAAKHTLPGLTPLVTATADAIGELFDRSSRAVKSPFWQGFKADLDGAVKPAFVGLGVAVGKVFTGIAGIVDAFLPHMGGISTTLQRITDKFARWATGLKGSPEFEKFLSFASRVGPGLADAFGKVADALLSVSKALAPLSGPVLEGFGIVADGISAVADYAPEAVLGIYALVVAMNVAKLGLIAWNGAMAVYNAIVAIATAETITWDVALQATGIVPLITLIVAAIAGLVAGVIYAYNHFTWFHVAVDAVWAAIKIGALFLWNNVLKPTFEAIWIGLQYVGKAAMWLWENALRPAFEGIWLAARILFAIVAVAVLAPLVIGFKVLAAVGMWLWEVALKPVFGFIGDAAVWMWKNYIKPSFDGVVLILKALGIAGMWLWTNALKPAFEAIGAVASWLWEKALKPAFEKTKDALRPLGQAFESAKDLIAAAWNKLYDITKKPINFLIEWVYTKGIKAVWDKVADFVDLPHLPDAPKLLAAGGTVGNGWGPAVPMMTNRPTAIVGEGNPLYPEFVIPTDPKYRDRALAMHAAAGTRLMASGGILGSIWDGIKGAGGAAWDFTKDGADLFAHPGKAWEKLTKPVRDLIAKIGQSSMAKTIAGIPTKAVGGLADKLSGFIGLGGGGGGGNGGSGVQQWAPTVLQALSMLGQPSSWLDVVLRRMNQESGGNPNVVNRWDSNWLAGTPSVGLMQVIGPTFRAYAEGFRNTGPFLYGTSTNPLANIFAGLNYAQHRYGSLSALNRPGGYDQGGYLPTGTSLVYNHSGKPEPVFTTGQWDAIKAGGLNGGHVPNVQIDNRTFLGDREITDLVRTEVDVKVDGIARDLYAGVK